MAASGFNTFILISICCYITFSLAGSIGYLWFLDVPDYGTVLNYLISLIFSIWTATHSWKYHCREPRDYLQEKKAKRQLKFVGGVVIIVYITSIVFWIKKSYSEAAPSTGLFIVSILFFGDLWLNHVD